VNGAISKCLWSGTAAYAKVRTSHVLTLAVFVAALASSVASAASLEGLVVSVSDGDTLTVLDEGNVQHKVRLAGIDAPEKRQAFGARAQQALGAAVHRQSVSVVWQKKDRYGRIVGKVLVQGQDVGLSLVGSGLAWHYKAYEREQSASDRGAYAQAEVIARSRRLGLWRDDDPMPPWDFRKRPRAK